MRSCHDCVYLSFDYLGGNPDIAFCTNPNTDFSDEEFDPTEADSNCDFFAWDEDPDVQEILEAAKGFLIEKGSPGFSLIGINWIDEENHWCVSFVSEYSNHEFISVFVEKSADGYLRRGHSFERPEFSV